MTAPTNYKIQQIEYSRIKAGNNDRKKFSQNGLEELAASIRTEGLLQPLNLRPVNGHYEIIAGERRFRACGLLDWPTVPAIVSTMDDERAAAAMLAENVHRVDLDPVEEGKAYASRMEIFGWDVKQCAENAHITTNRVSARLSLLSLREDVQHLVSSGQLKNGYAVILAGAELDPNFQMLAVRALRENPAPNTMWFARTCGELAEQQNQAYLFENLDLFGGDIKPMFDLAPVENIRPALPLEVDAPGGGSTPEEVLENQIAFWQEAAEQWDDLCSAYFLRECQSAVRALETALVAVRKAPQKERLF